MLILVTGGSCSGKSGFAEKLLAETGADTKKYYIATMDAADEESKARVQRHRTQRAGKGFVTIEQARDVHLAAGEIQAKRKISERTAALLECMSNLTANEMFGADKVQSEQVVIEKVCRDIAQLEKALDLLIIVTNNVFEDGVQYDEATESYLRALGRMNAWLAERAEQVYEVVVGVPILWKNENKRYNMSEIFDIVDEKGMPTGETVSRDEAHEKGIRHRTAHIWVVRRAGDKVQMLLQKRAQDKDSFPGCYDTSSAGHIQAGDEPLESASRELFEELGIAAGEKDLDFAGCFAIEYEKVFHGKPFHDNEVAFVYMYSGPVDSAELTLQAEEVESVAWFDVEELQGLLEPRDSRFCVPMAGFLLGKKWCDQFMKES